ncbi:MAG: 3-mercaptopyruvate sulfurtransferase [Rhodospirillales bacterium]|nr:3-mercaptopyruvate sulfurtransferase [Rhodospirillales bacterium]
MSGDETPLVVTPAWLTAALGADDAVQVLDGSWHLPTLGRDPAAEFLEAHIPGAAFFDIDGICDPDSALPHMLPSPELFAGSVSALGVGDDSHVVVYDTVGLYSAARVWWMFRVFGHERVSILAGGLPRWRAEGRPVESGKPAIAPAQFKAARRDDTMVRSFEQVRATLGTGGAQIVDARAAARFTGEDPGPRPDLPRGHIPGSRNVPFNAVLDDDDAMLGDAAAIRSAFADAGVDPARPVIATCGSGITACTLALALAAIGAEEVAVYDGSWSDWGSRADAPVESGGPA